MLVPSGVAAPLPFPSAWPPEFRRHAEALGPAGPLLRLGTPHASEAGPDPEAWPDPTGDRRLRPVPFVVRKHRHRAVLLATGRCAFYCRFCFRRGAPEPEPTPADLNRAFEWLQEARDVREVILSGGDPLTLPDADLRALVRRLEAVPHVERWRLHTRAPVVWPRRVTPGLLAALRSDLPLRVVVHAAHPAELRPAFARTSERLAAAGIPLLDQTVLLAGTNDDPETLSALFRGLASLGVAPHYLHHPDRAPGNRSFRLTLRRGLEVYRALRAAWPAAPPYVVDLPNGAGKVPAEALEPVGEDGLRTRWRWTRPAGWDSLVEDGSCEWWDVAGSQRHRAAAGEGG